MPDGVERNGTEEFLLAGWYLSHRRDRIRHDNSFNRFLSVSIELLQQKTRIGTTYSPADVVEFSKCVLLESLRLFIILLNTVLHG